MSLSLGPGSAASPGEAPPEERGRSPWLTVVVVALLVLGGLVANVVSKQAHSSDGSDDGGGVRNAIVFLVDDMPDFPCSDAAGYLPKTSHWLVQRGTCYDNATSSTPVCCPARAQIQTGQYSHNNRVISQIRARDLVVDDTVQRDLGLAGISTYGIGKNLNGLSPGLYYGPAAVDNGFEEFDFWDSYRGAPGTFRRYDDYGRKYLPEDGLTQTETNGALLDAYLDDKLATGEPFYVYDAFVAPHKQSGSYGPPGLPPVAPEHADDPVPAFRWAPEGNGRDKLEVFRKPRFDRAYYKRLYTARVRSLFGVDDQMAATMQRLEDAGVLDETVVIFTSDNGYTDRGQVNWEGKSIPYPAATNIPMMAWYPDRSAAVDRRPVALVDVPATLYDALGVTPGHQLDGHSLLGDHRREVVLAEYYSETSRLAALESGPYVNRLLSWRVVKRGREAYVEWYGPRGQVVFREYYRDPGMLFNLLSPVHRRSRPTREVIARFRGYLRRYATCQGTVEQGSPRPCP